MMVKRGCLGSIGNLIDGIIVAADNGNGDGDGAGNENGNDNGNSKRPFRGLEFLSLHAQMAFFSFLCPISLFLSFKRMLTYHKTPNRVGLYGHAPYRNRPAS